MNKALASFLFSEEQLFHLKEESPATVQPQAPPPVQEKVPCGRTVVLLPHRNEVDFLSKIMAAVGISMNEVQMMVGDEWKNYDMKPAQYLINFQENFPSLANAPKYETLTRGSRKVLVGDPLEKIQQNQANEKRLLWNALKEMFGLS